VENLTRAIVNRILKEPVLRIREFALEDSSEVFVTSLCRLFDLNEELNGQPVSSREEERIGAVAEGGRQ